MTPVRLLAGINDPPERFLDAGFDTAVRARGAPLGLELLRYEPEALVDPGAIARIEAQALASNEDEPNAWLVGVSLGGYLALQCARRRPDRLAGVCLIAPYLGGRGLIAEIARAPGLAAWSPGTSDADDDDRKLWRFLKERADDLPLYLGAGTADRFASAHALLATRLPRGRTQFLDGGHDWPTWRRIWDAFLDTGIWR